MTETIGISPSEKALDLQGPGGARVVLEDPAELGEGGPTIGRLVVSGIGPDGQQRALLEDASPSVVWDETGQRLAFPRWSRDINGWFQMVQVLDCRSLRIAKAPGAFRVLRLDRYTEGRVQGIDSPDYMPAPLNVAIPDVWK